MIQAGSLHILFGDANVPALPEGYTIKRGGWVKAVKDGIEYCIAENPLRLYRVMDQTRYSVRIDTDNPILLG